MDSFSSDDTLNDVDGEMPCHNTGTEIVVRHHIDILNASIRYDNFCIFDRIDWGNYIQRLEHSHPPRRRNLKHKNV